MKKIVTILGARPQFIKAALISNEIKKYKSLKEIIIHTGQHHHAEMSDVFFQELKIPSPDFNLNINGGTHGSMTGKMLIEIERLLIKINPDLVIVYGDTNSTLAGAIATSKLNIKLAHVEAGLRSFNKLMPEELNRIITDHASSLLFAPSVNAKQNLLNEGIKENKINVVGDVMYDLALKFSKIKPSRFCNRLIKFKPYILATIHRQENTDNCKKLENISNALIVFSNKFRIIWPLHPRTKTKLFEYKLFEKLNKSVEFIEPQGYINMINLLKNAMLVVTDSGGVQKEAFYFKTSCVTVREETEWVELLNTNWMKLCAPSSKNKIVKHLNLGLKTKGKNCLLYGKGDASKKVVSEIYNYLK